MAPKSLLSLSLALLSSSLCSYAQFIPLVDKHFSYPDGIPYQVDTDNLIRGTQTGYNRCNATTQNQASLCQTSFLNSLQDFCLWGAIAPDSLVGNVEGEMVAWCSQPNHGSRIIPRQTLKGVQFMRTPDYVQVVGFIEQSNINIKTGDFGGEMDPHGADLRGNPLGGLMYSNAFGTNENQFTQVIEWHNFIGSNFFCLKACDPSKPNAANFCQHIYDRIGCAYNAPNNAQPGVFESCDGDNQDFPGVYTDSTGATLTYKQPPESLGPITSLPYTARVPASSNCRSFTSEVIYQAEATVVAPGASSSSGTASRSTTATGSATQPTKTSNRASALVGPGIAFIWGIAFAIVFASA